MIHAGHQSGIRFKMKTEGGGGCALKNFEFGHGRSETRSHRVLLIFRRFSFGVASRTLQRIILGPFHCVLGAFFFSSKKNTHTQQNNQCDAVVPRHVPTHRLRCCVRNSILLTVHRRSRRRKTIPSFEFRTFTEFFFYWSFPPVSSTAVLLLRRNRGL